MDLFSIFRGRPAIRVPHELAQFIDENAAFLVQKWIYEYSRARAGHYAKVLFKEPMFLEAAEQSRWRSYPLGLAMVAELVEGVLRPHACTDPLQQLETLSALVLSVFDRYPTPEALDEHTWIGSRTELARRLQLIGLHPPKRAMDIPAPFAEAFFNLMPIHPKLSGRDFPTMHNYLKVSLCNMHDELTKRLDAPILTTSLHAGPG